MMQIILFIIFIVCGIALKEILLTPGPEAVSIVAHQSEYRGRNAIPVHPINAGSAKLPDLLIKETEQTLENNTRGP